MVSARLLELQRLGKRADCPLAVRAVVPELEHAVPLRRTKALQLAMDLHSSLVHCLCIVMQREWFRKCEQHCSMEAACPRQTLHASCRDLLR